MARVLLAHAHLLRFDRKQHQIGKPYPPLATLFAAAHLRALGHEVALFDPMLDDDTGGFAPALARARPDVVVLYDDTFNWFTKMCLGRMRAAAFGMMRQARQAGARVVVSGHDAADAPEAYLEGGADFVVVGEGEITLGELLAHPALLGPTSVRAPGAPGAPGLDQIAGLVFRERGLFRRTGPRALLKDLDALPLPAWDLVDVGRYRRFWLGRHGYFSLNVVTTRGCPYLCNWCAKPAYGNTYHTRSPDNVLAELALLRARHAPDHIWFCDDILGLKQRWLLPFAEQARARGLATPFLCQSRVDLMTDENVRALHEAGAAEVWLGVESGAQGVLDAMDKGITIAQTRAAVSRLRARGIRVGFFLQFGYPDEAWPEIEATRALVAALAPDDLGISVSYPLPGTRFHARVAGLLGDKRNWVESGDLDPLFPGRYAQPFYQALSRLVHAEHRIRRGATALGRMLGDPLGSDGQRLALAAGMLQAGRWTVERARLARHSAAAGGASPDASASARRAPMAARRST